MALRYHFWWIFVLFSSFWFWFFSFSIHPQILNLLNEFLYSYIGQGCSQGCILLSPGNNYDIKCLLNQGGFTIDSFSTSTERIYDIFIIKIIILPYTLFLPIVSIQILTIFLWLKFSLNLTWIQRSSWFSAEGSHLWILFWLVNLLEMIKGRIWFDSQGMAPFSPSLRVDPKQITLYRYIPLCHFSKVINYNAQSSKMTPSGRWFEPCWDGQNGGGLLRTTLPNSKSI